MRRVTTTAAIGYVLGFILWRILVASPLYIKWWPLQVSEVFGLWLLAPLPFLLIAGIIWRSRGSWLALALPLLWFGSQYGGLFLPDLTPRAWASGETSSLRSMTLNTWTQRDGDGDLAAALQEWQPDIIALQEVGALLPLDLAALSDEWPYQVHANIRVLTTVAFVSKVPILDVDADNLWDGCHCMQVVIDWQGRAIRVFVVHIRSPRLGATNYRWQPLHMRRFDTSEQEEAYAALLPLIEASREPVIVLGDFNTTEREAGYHKMIDAGLKNAHAEVGWGPGFTYPAPHSHLDWLPSSIIRIDHIFYDKAWRATQTWTTPLMGSDHQTLVADLQWIGDD